MRHSLCAIVLAALPLTSMAFTEPAPETADGDRLTATITALDNAVFNAYNHCDLVTFARYFAPGIEFYHDKTGLSVGRTKLVEAVKNNICGKVRRELVPGTMEVYPLKGFGAVELGVHRFCKIDGGRCEGIARFVHLWQYHDGAWRITRVISYDHQPTGP